MTVATPGFPNFFHIGGPTGNWGSGCVLASVCSDPILAIPLEKRQLTRQKHEVQADYAIQACLKISTERLHSVMPKADPTEQYMEFTAGWHAAHSCWGEDCKSWYKNGGRADGEVMLWCGSSK